MAEGRLSHAVTADNRDRLVADLQVDPVQDVSAAVVGMQVADDERWSMVGGPGLAFSHRCRPGMPAWGLVEDRRCRPP